MSEKEFYITDYEWDDSDIQYSHRSSEDIYFDIKGTQLPIFISKQDVIAMAKHFKLTEEDLERG